MRSKIEVTCSNPDCGKKFLKDKSEANRNKKIGRSNYCSLKCSGHVNNKHLPKGSPSHLRANNRRDKYTGLREHFTRVKQRVKDHDIDLDDLLKQWKQQKGICPYTGIKLLHPRDAKDKPLMYKASLDRIDSNQGYVADNIQFVSACANLAKNSMSHDEMIEFCKVVADRWK